MEQPDQAVTEGPRVRRRFLNRVALVDGIGLLFLLALAAIWYAAHALLLVFACILFALLLYDASRRVCCWTGLPRRWSMALVLALLALALGGGGWLMAPQLGEQAIQLGQQLPHALLRLRESIAATPLLKHLAGELPSVAQLGTALSDLLPRAGLFFSGIAGALGSVVIVLFVGTYFALQPFLYIDGLVTLVPPRYRQRAREVLNEAALSLSHWLFGKVVSMVAVAAVTAAGLAVLGVPLALILGIIAGLLDFIPYLGPLLAGVPAVLIALSVSPELALYTAALMVAIQLAEGYLLEPLMTRRMAALPPALTIVMQVLLGAVFGLAGVALATPLTVVLVVLVSMLYVQDVLGDQVRTPSEMSREKGGPISG
jgi:predicted PurR-regulated permease PerM